MKSTLFSPTWITHTHPRAQELNYIQLKAKRNQAREFSLSMMHGPCQTNSTLAGSAHHYHQALPWTHLWQIVPWAIHIAHSRVLTMYNLTTQSHHRMSESLPPSMLLRRGRRHWRHSSPKKMQSPLTRGTSKGVPRLITVTACHVNDATQEAL